MKKVKVIPPKACVLCDHHLSFPFSFAYFPNQKTCSHEHALDSLPTVQIQSFQINGPDPLHAQLRGFAFRLARATVLP